MDHTSLDSNPIRVLLISGDGPRQAGAASLASGVETIAAASARVDAATQQVRMAARALA